ncbi:MAG: hypothetical protein QMD76_00575 [Anaerosomatales bacterium]|nr:hypothetical protein [Coriobacteriia bacterium]MDI6691798.1 hypothetical protein [Anaerosomatales bacterium]
MDRIAAAQFRIEPREGRTTRELVQEIREGALRALAEGLAKRDGDLSQAVGPSASLLVLHADFVDEGSLLRINDESELQRIGSAIEKWMTMGLSRPGEESGFKVERGGKLVHLPSPTDAWDLSSAYKVEVIAIDAEGQTGLEVRVNR